MMLKKVNHSRVAQLFRPSVAIWLLASVILGLIGFALTGCNRQQDVPPPPPQPAAEIRQPRFVQQRIPEPQQQQNAVKNPPPNAALPIYELKMAPVELDGLEQTVYSKNTHPAKFVANGVSYDGVKVRYRGAWARSWPKKPLKIFFNSAKRFDGQDRINLNSAWHDPAFVREPLAYQVYAACGVPSPKSRMVRLDVNGKFRGLYVEVEQPEKAFLKRLNLKGATVIKATSRSNQADERDLGNENSYRGHYDLETQKAQGYGELQRFCHEVEHNTNTLEFFTRRVDIEKYINYLAATVLTQNWDGFNKNHFLVYDGGGSKKWFAVPWDLDRTFGDHWNWSFDSAELPVLLGTQQMPGITGWNRLANRFFSEPTLRSQFLNRLEELLQKEFTPQKLFPILDRDESQIAAEAVLDRQLWPSQTSDLHGGIAQVKSYIERRRAYLLSELPRLRQSNGLP